MTATVKPSALATASQPSAKNSKSIVQWTCSDCRHMWRAHALVKQCPKCKSRSILGDPVSAVQLGREHMEGRNGDAVSGAAPPLRLSSPADVPGFPHLIRGEGRLCLGCGDCFEAPGVTCPKCGGAQFRLTDSGDQPANWACEKGHAFYVTPRGRPGRCCVPSCESQHVIRLAPVHPAATSTTTPAGIVANDPDVAPPPSPQSPAPVPSAAAGERIEQIPALRIDPSPTQPRVDFDETKLEAMAHGFKTIGGIQEPLLVRRKEHGRYELVAGERRLRAAKLARLGTVPCKVIDVTDEEAIEIQARENLDREDLNPIEKARQYQILLERCGLTQESLAKRFDTTQGTISNALRLLKLPQAWQKRIIRREISPTHAEILLPWTDLAGLPEKVDELIKKAGGDIGSAKDFREMLAEALEPLTRSINPDDYGRAPCHFRPSKEQRAQLDVREVPQRWGGRKELRACNLALWDELNKKAKARKRAEAKAKPKPKKPSWQLESERLAAARERERWGKELYLEKANWYARSIGEKLDPAKHEGLLLRALWALVALDENGEVGQDIADIVDAKGDRYSGRFDGQILGLLVGLRAASLQSLPLELARRALSRESDEAYRAPGFPALHAWLAKELKLDFEREWRPTEAFVTLYCGDSGPESREDLAALVEHWPADARGDRDQIDPRTATPEAVLKAWPPGFVPRELLLVDEKGKIPSGKPKKAGKKKAKSG